jgi:hypothetical protein
VLTSWAGARFNPASLFAAGEQGAWYDPSDLSALFQDSAGTTPVTAVGQPVGKMLDKSGRGNHATQATAASRPILQQDSNGKYYLAFDGVSSSYFGLARPAGFTPEIHYAVSLQDTNGRFLVDLRDAGVGGYYWQDGVGVVALIGGNTMRTTDPFTGVPTLGSFVMTQVVTKVALMANNAGAFPLQAKLYGWVEVGRTLTTAERAALDSYLSRRSGVTL